jgi:phosphatidate phosphatase PAH1
MANHHGNKRKDLTTDHTDDTDTKQMNYEKYELRQKGNIEAKTDFQRRLIQRNQKMNSQFHFRSRRPRHQAAHCFFLGSEKCTPFVSPAFNCNESDAMVVVLK